MPQLDLGSVLGPQGPKGDPGNQGTVGPRGPQGEQGDAGKDATINGVNALQISVGQGLKESQEGGTYSIAMGDEDYKNLQNAKGAVRFDQAQTLTPAQQEQAQHNIGTTWPCNPNLLDNWYFGRPVNQRGVTELASGNWSTYFIDRWVAAAPECAYAITDDGIKISDLPHQYQQIVLQKMERMEKRTYTLSFLLKSIGLLSLTFTPQGSDYTEQTLDGGFIVSFMSEADLTNPTIRLLDSASVTVSDVTLLAAKLELGPTQTLAHQENGVWVLNEVPDYGEQLRRCQRYRWRLHSVAKNNYAIFAYGQKQSTEQVRFVVNFPVTLRASPAIISNGKFLVSDGVSDYAVDSIEKQSFNGNSIVIVAKSTAISALPNGTCMRFGAYNDTTAYIDFSADL